MSGNLKKKQKIFLFFFCLLPHPGLLTLCGASLYIVYSYQALAETKRLVGPEGLAYIQTSFGWSLGLAWLSYGLELLTGTLLLIAAQMARIRQRGPSKAWRCPPRRSLNVPNTNWSDNGVDNFHFFIFFFQVVQEFHRDSDWAVPPCGHNCVYWGPFWFWSCWSWCFIRVYM